MNLQQFLFILRARYLIIVLSLLTTVSVTFVVSLMLPKQYTATASLVVDFKSPDPISALAAPLSMGTQVDIINSDRVSRKVVRIMKLDQNSSLRERWAEETGSKGRMEDWAGELIQRQLSVNPSRDSNVINISYKAVDPVFAATIVNAFAQAYIDANIELKVEPARDYARWFGEQGKVLRENLEKAQTRLSEFQQQKGIVTRDEQLDVETAKLAELSAQLSAVQGQNTDSRSKQRSLGSADTLPEVMQNPVVSGLRSDIARQEAKLKEAETMFGTNHPQYQRLVSEIDALKEKLRQETRHIAAGFKTSQTVGRDKEAELKEAIAAQKRKLLEFKNERDQMAVFQRDVDAAHAAYDAVAKRYTQASLESQATQTNVSVLTPAVPPLQPSSPKILRYVVIAIFLGTMLGVGGAFMIELLDRRIRSSDDLSEALELPVLGVLRRPRRVRHMDFLRLKRSLLPAMAGAR